MAERRESCERSKVPCIEVSAVCEPAAVFLEHKIVPDVVAMGPVEFLKVTYPNGIEVDKGAELTPTQVKKQPHIEWEADPKSFYTVIMTDPDAPSRKAPKFREWHHWLVTNIPGNQVQQGQVLTAYVGAGPPQGTGLHRYVFLVFKQPSQLKFKEPHIPKTSGEKRPNFSTAQFCTKYKFSVPVAGNFFQAQYDDYVPQLYKQLASHK